VPNEYEKVQSFTQEAGIDIVADIARSDDINTYEDQGMTVIEGDASLPISQAFFALADRLIEEEQHESCSL
jgi:nitrogenase iron protein NifH